MSMYIHGCVHTVRAPECVLNIDCFCILQECLRIQPCMAILVANKEKAPLYQDWQALFTCAFVSLGKGSI